LKNSINFNKIKLNLTYCAFVKNFFFACKQVGETLKFYCLNFHNFTPYTQYWCTYLSNNLCLGRTCFGAANKWHH